MSQIVVGRRLVGGRVVGTIRSLVNAKNLQLECDRDLHELLLVPVLMCGSETIVVCWISREGIKSRMHG